MLLAVALLLPQQLMAITIEMVSIPAGSFIIGSDSSTNVDEKPAHKVSVSAFEMAKYELTQAQYTEIMGNNPSSFKGGDLPVERVSWYDAQAFIEQLNRKTGMHYRLPSEAEWEYAARAGSCKEYSWGDGEGHAYKYAWYQHNSEMKTHPVGTKKPNAFGLYDMNGNVWEWVEDCYNINYMGAPVNGEAWQSGDCSKRVLRGGSWGRHPGGLRVADRGGSVANIRDNDDGFRLVLDHIK